MSFENQLLNRLKDGPAQRVLFFLFLFLVFGFLVAAGKSAGFVWDETLYFGFARRTAEAFALVLSDLKGFHLARAFEDLRDAPAWKIYPQIGFLARYVQGFFYLCFHSLLGDPWAFRAGSAFLWTGMLYFLFRISGDAFGKGAGWLAMAVALGFPRLLGHAFLGTTESALLLMWTAGIFFYLKCFRGEWPAWVFGVFFGLAMTAKFQVFGLLLGATAWGMFFDRRTASRMLAWAALLGPVVFLAVQPCYWLDPFPILRVYFGQWVFHNKFAVPLYFLREQIRGHGPWFYSPLILAFTIPLPYFLLGLRGAYDAVVEKNRDGLLFLCLGLTPLVMLMSPNAPAYDGERLFIQAFPCWVLLAAGGILGLLKKIKINYASVLVLLFAFSFLVLARTHPFYSEYYSLAAGGPAGAEKLGLETSYSMGGLNREGIRIINGTVPSGVNIGLKGYPEHLMALYQEIGWLRNDIRFTRKMDSSVDYLLVYFRQSDLDEIETLKKMRPAAQVQFQDVTIFKLVEKHASPAKRAPGTFGVKAAGSD